jgi:hypothetical protein
VFSLVLAVDAPEPKSGRLLVLLLLSLCCLLGVLSRRVLAAPVLLVALDLVLWLMEFKHRRLAEGCSWLGLTADLAPAVFACLDLVWYLGAGMLVVSLQPAGVSPSMQLPSAWEVDKAE